MIVWMHEPSVDGLGGTRVGSPFDESMRIDGTDQALNIYWRAGVAYFLEV